MAFLLFALCAYLAGSIPFGYLAGKIRGVDIRTLGSGNIGATNVFRSLGPKPGVSVFALDAAKGAFAVVALPAICRIAFGGASPWLPVACAVAVMLGHSFPVFLGFRGGKGVATGLGIAIGLAPWSALAGLGVWIALFLATRYVSVASIGAALTVGCGVWFLDTPAGTKSAGAAGLAAPVAISVMAALVVLKHRSNVARLVRGTENRFCFTKRQLAKRDALRQGAGR